MVRLTLKALVAMLNSPWVRHWNPTYSWCCFFKRWRKHFEDIEDTSKSAIQKTQMSSFAPLSSHHSSLSKILTVLSSKRMFSLFEVQKCCAQNAHTHSHLRNFSNKRDRNVWFKPFTIFVSHSWGLQYNWDHLNIWFKMSTHSLVAGKYDLGSVATIAIPAY